ncbi:MAG: hypothetical protein HYV15_04330 [Elusimicrobia bacterium]|nr:hypothetical protein [Elusimicrobiota bacterium]
MDKIALLCAVLAAGAAAPSSAAVNGQGQDFGSRALKASEAALNNQFLSIPLPMTHYLKGKWQLGVSGGYSDVDAGVLRLRGGAAGVGFSYAVADKLGVYVLGFVNDQKVSGGGRELLLTPFLRAAPIATGESAEFSGVGGSARQLGFGAAGVYDPFVKDEKGFSMPFFAGLLLDRFELRNVKAGYRMLSGADAGQTGTLDLSGSYTFLMPMMGVQAAVDLGEKVRLVPAVLFSKTVGAKPQEGRITGTAPKVFDLSGDSRSAGSSDADFNTFVFAPGCTVVYRPWGLSTNLGATLFKRAVGAKLFDGVQKILYLDLSWRWGDFAK